MVGGMHLHIKESFPRREASAAPRSSEIEAALEQMPRYIAGETFVRNRNCQSAPSDELNTAKAAKLVAGTNEHTVCGRRW